MTITELWTRITSAPHDRLQHRRTQRMLRRWACALCAGLAVLCIGQAIAMMQATAPVLISTRDMPQGARIETSDVELAQLPVHDALAHACASVDDIEGTRAQIDIAHGQIIYPTMVSTMPVVAEGQTVIDVRLADGQQGFAIGTHVALSSMLPCGGDEMERGTPPLCTLSEDAWIMSETHDEGLVAMAMPAQDAIDVLAAQTQTPLLASKAP